MDSYKNEQPILNTVHATFSMTWSIQTKLDLNKIKIYGKSYKNIAKYYFGYVTLKNLSNVTINSVNP